jgi:hypothetical protein
MEARGEVEEDSSAGSHRGGGGGGGSALRKGCPSWGTDAAVSSIETREKLGRKGVGGGPGRKTQWEETWWTQKDTWRAGNPEAASDADLRRKYIIFLSVWGTVVFQPCPPIPKIVFSKF